jgi:hypothetical protein
MITRQALLILIVLATLPALSQMIRLLIATLVRLLAAAMALGIVVMILVFLAAHGK